MCSCCGWQKGFVHLVQILGSHQLISCRRAINKPDDGQMMAIMMASRSAVLLGVLL